MAKVETRIVTELAEILILAVAVYSVGALVDALDATGRASPSTDVGCGDS